ncbi:hypothetical protein [Streptomyces paludis]|uniref:Uncharacterized protein n=1 Tax=Streptomyces paludis TaxID=2282738 RepID=A0A345HM97_9ACTN|nr:hypothetical protein [Streptomyces paludis]AXG77821.1 hypothetical protein DVK44_09060 [Streptomyces paludis]
MTFFCVLSGFVLAWTYDGRQVPARVFHRRRSARIRPLLVASVVVSVAVWTALGAWHLFHEIVIRSLLGGFGKPEPGLDTALLWLVTLLISLTVAAIAYYYVEHPLERPLRRVGPAGPPWCGHSAAGTPALKSRPEPFSPFARPSPPPPWP